MKETLECEVRVEADGWTTLRSSGNDEVEGPSHLGKLTISQLLGGLDDPAYGHKLFRALLPPEGRVLRSLALTRERARRAGTDLRFRLRISENAGAELHRLRWEKLEDPEVPGEAPLSCQEVLTFSRVFRSRGNGSAPFGSSRPRLLVAIAAPALSSNGSLAPIDPHEVQSVFLELQRKFEDRVDIEFLRGPVTRRRLGKRLERGSPVDLLHLHAHGGYREGKGLILLETEGGDSELVPDEFFAELLPGRRRPRLVTLMSCHSARATGEGAYGGVARRLVELGIPAVFAIEREVEMGTALDLCTSFYSGLLEHGEPEVAANRARRELYQKEEIGGDAWAGAVLLLAEDTGVVLPAHGPTGELVVRRHRPTFPDVSRLLPVLGPMINRGTLPLVSELVAAQVRTDGGLTETVGSSGIAALAWFLETRDGPRAPHLRVASALRRALAGGGSNEGWRPDLGYSSIQDEADNFAEACEPSGIPGRAHRLLARLPVPLYLTLNHDPLLTSFLRRSKRTPTTAAYPLGYVRDRGWAEYQALEGTVGSPLILHLFGSANAEEMVLADPEIFGFLGHFGRGAEDGRLPHFIAGSLEVSELLFLGFDLFDLGCRAVLWRLLKRLGPRSPGAVLVLEPSFRETPLGHLFGSGDRGWRQDLQLRVEYEELVPFLETLVRQARSER